LIPISRAHLARITILALLALGLLALFIRVTLTARLSGSPCGSSPPLVGRIDSNVLAVIGVTAFVLGGAFGSWRRSGAASPANDEIRHGDVVIQAALVVLLFFITSALVYETYALVTPGIWPISYYVRCANYIDPLWTLIGLAVTAGLLGHWLWRPARRS
jgi:hypothetical protein